jgi:protein-tyrosine phosphatase
MRGLDRSPFIAALAMIRGGVDVQKAIARVQKARPGALERNKQLVAALRDG